MQTKSAGIIAVFIALFVVLNMAGACVHKVNTVCVVLVRAGAFTLYCTVCTALYIL